MSTKIDIANRRAYRTLELVRSLAKYVWATGSRVTVNPPPTDTDADFLVHVDPKHLHDIIKLLNDAGFESDVGSVMPDSTAFSSYSLGEVNLILTGDKKFYDRWIVAHGLCKHLNLAKKEDRIAVYAAVRGVE